MGNPFMCGYGGCNNENKAADALAAVNATVDMECQGSFGNLVDLAKPSSKVLQQMQAAVARTFKGRFQLGQFDPNSTTAPYANLTNLTLSSPEHQALNQEASEQSIVLLQNPPAGKANHLPLRRGQTIAVVGPNGASTSALMGEYQGPACPEDPTNRTTSPLSLPYLYLYLGPAGPEEPRAPVTPPVISFIIHIHF